jgi:plastocyanin
MPTTPPRSFQIGCAMTAAVLILGFSPEGPRPIPAPAATVRMTAENSFEPQVVTIHPGEEVVWKNEGHSLHSVVGDPLLAAHRIDIEPPAPPEPFHSDDVEPGRTYVRRFTLEGVYRYVCRHHEEQGMNGTVIVKAGR